MSETPLLALEGVWQAFAMEHGAFLRRPPAATVLKDVNLTLQASEALGLAGESGSGKSTLAKCILQAPAPVRGKVYYRGHDVQSLSRADRRALRHEIQYVFQDPLAALDPRWSVLPQVAEPLDIHRVGSRASRANAARIALRQVGLGAELEKRLPHQLSGGQRQRVVLARALVLQPKLLICDEPVSALDVSIQAQIVNLLKTLWREAGLSLLFISHDLALLSHLCQRIVVIYAGEVREIAPTEDLFSRPAHPYTRSLIDAVPAPDPTRRQAAFEPAPLAAPPDPTVPLSGCSFRNRCPKARQLCAERSPALQPFGKGRLVACHFPLKDEAV